MPTNHHYEKGNDKLHFSAHNFLKVVLVRSRVLEIFITNIRVAYMLRISTSAKLLCTHSAIIFLGFHFIQVAKNLSSNILLHNLMNKL
jgi:hypothetical protein